MSYTYKIRSLLNTLDSSICPPPFLSVIFPEFDGSQAVSWRINDNGVKECWVTFDEPQTPAYVDPMIQIEEIS